MFMKVYQYPPRRGNGSYWTLLPDGEDELKRAIPLFSTFQPPLIDPESVYNRTPTTHTVKSRGQFIPVLPRSNRNTTNQPYFSVNSFVMNLIPQQEQVLVLGSLEDTSSVKQDSNKKCITRIPKHLLDHNYTKQLPDSLKYRKSPRGDKCSNKCFIDPEPFPEEVFTPKRKKLVHSSVKNRNRYVKSQRTFNRENCHGSNASEPTAGSPSKEHDISFGFLDSSLLTPLKDIVNDIEIGGPGGISLSPLYANFVSPHDGTPKRRLVSKTGSSPSTPLADPSMDSGIFTPFRLSTSLASPNMQCSTPLKLFSPLPNLLPGTPHRDLFPSLKVSHGTPDSSIRIGSLQALGVSGLTPPSV